MGLGAPPRNGVASPKIPAVKIDPGPAYPGYNCHIVIDNVGYIFADIGSATSETQRQAAAEELAPYFGNPQNAFDPLSSDLTMLLPIGQNDFTGGLGGTDLERTPKSYERVEHLMLTPQGTLINGPLINFEPFSTNLNPSDPRGYQEGYFGGSVTPSGTLNTYFGVGNYLYNRHDTSLTWVPLPARAPITDIVGYSGRVIVGYGDDGDVFYNSTQYAAMHRIHKVAIVNSNPFVVYRDGRFYSAFIMPPDNPTITDETGPDVTLAHFSYAVAFVIKMPDNSLYSTGLGLLGFATKLPNRELVIGVPTRGYKGGPVMRRLYRSSTPNMTDMYLIADETVLGSNATQFVDTITDAIAITKPKYDWTQVNDTGIVPLIAGETNRNMQFPDTKPIWLPQKFVPPAVSDFVNTVTIFHDAQGNEGAMVGTTSGLFSWNGSNTEFETLNLNYYHPLNYKYMAANHGVIYFTLMGHSVYVWTPNQQQELQGPWLTQYTSINEVRIANHTKYLSVAVTGVTKYNPGTNTCTIYLFNGTVFVWSYSWQAAAINDVTPVVGGLHNADALAHWRGPSAGGIHTMALDPLYTARQTTGVLFRSSGSDADLPRLRKQVHALMIRYLQLSPPPPSTVTTSDSNPGDTTITIDDANGLNIGDWIRIAGNNNNLVQHEYRQILDRTGPIVFLGHTLGAALIYPHAVNNRVQKCAAVTVLRNVFTDSLPTQDIEVGGPCDPNELFSYCRLPVPVYTYSDGIQINYNDGTVMELIGWAMLTGLNPQWNGLMDLSIRLQDNVKLPNNLYDNALASERQQQLKDAYNKGTVLVLDPLGVPRVMRFQRLNFTYEEPKERHSDGTRMQATATVRLIDQMSELQKQSELVLNLRSQ